MVFIPQAQPHAQSLFLFPIGFGINVFAHAAYRKNLPCVAFVERSRELRGRLPDHPCVQTSALYAVAPSHARDRWEFRDPCLANETV